MKFRLFVAALAAVALAGLVACGSDTPTETQECMDTMVQPQIIHLKVGQAQEFTASGGLGDGRFTFNFERPNLVNLEQTSGIKATVTVLGSIQQPEYGFALTAQSGYCPAGKALVYISE